MPTVHDSLLVGYEVDGEGGRIVLHTERRVDGLAPDRMDVVLSGVEAYAFRNDCLVSILFDLREEPLVAAFDARWAELEAGFRESGWPRFWQGEPAKTRERVFALAAEGVRSFELSSSYGIEGWVFCRTVEYRSR